MKRRGGRVSAMKVRERGSHDLTGGRTEVRERRKEVEHAGHHAGRRGKGGACD